MFSSRFIKAVLSILILSMFGFINSCGSDSDTEKGPYESSFRNINTSNKFTVPMADITVDGDYNDWLNVDICVNNIHSQDDRYNEANGHYPNLDYIKIAKSLGNDSIFLLFKPVDVFEKEDQQPPSFILTLQSDREDAFSCDNYNILVGMRWTYRGGQAVSVWYAYIQQACYENPNQINKEGVIIANENGIECSFDITDLLFNKEIYLLGNEDTNDYFRFDGAILF